MADKTEPGGTPSENQKNIEPGKKDEKIFSNETDMIPQDQKKETMEVHHHPDLHHDRKYFREYFLEFLMIFLAVTMGFIAENIREHITEHKNAKILAQSLLEDVKADTASLQSLINFSNKKIYSVDNTLEMMHTPRNVWNVTRFYTNMLPMVTSLPFKSTDGTYTQMKTSGTLRYFNQSLVNIINAYDVQLKKTAYRDEVEDKGIWLLANMLFENINVEVITDIRLNIQVTHDPFIRMKKKETLDKFINLLAVNKGFRIRTLQEYKLQLKIADKLIDALKKEYHLD